MHNELSYYFVHLTFMNNLSVSHHVVLTARPNKNMKRQCSFKIGCNPISELHFNTISCYIITEVTLYDNSHFKCISYWFYCHVRLSSSWHWLQSQYRLLWVFFQFMFSYVYIIRSKHPLPIVYLIHDCYQNGHAVYTLI